jgi:hypothetical protein
VTLQAPLALGGMRLASFREHVSVVIVTSAALLGFLWALRFGAGLADAASAKGPEPAHCLRDEKGLLSLFVQNCGGPSRALRF